MSTNDSSDAIIRLVTITARLVRQARRRAGLTQRALATSAGVPQSTIGRIETGRLTPRVDTLERVLQAAGHSLEAAPMLGRGVDRSQIRELLRLTAGERVRLAVADSAAIDAFDRSRRE